MQTADAQPDANYRTLDAETSTPYGEEDSAMHAYLTEMLECPSCHAGLTWRIGEHVGDRIETADACCAGCGLQYPVREGIGVFLLPGFRRNDLWAQLESSLSKYLQEHPQVERQLLEAPLQELSTADQHFRASILEERGQLAEAKAVRAAAAPIYTSEQQDATRDQTEFVLEHLTPSGGPVVDLASGYGGFVEEIARRLDRPAVATDFSPTVLRKDRARLEQLGLYGRVDLVSFDARQTPLKDGAVKTMTSHHGLPNIQEPGPLLGELRRIVSGEFIATTLFYDERDDRNAAAIREYQLEDLLYRDRVLAGFRGAGWKVEILNERPALARPTPRSKLLDAGIDGLPVAETTLVYCVLLATPAKAENKRQGHNKEMEPAR